MSNPYPVDLTSVTAPTPRVRTYTVQEGDTLRNIARHIYNNPLEARRIAAINSINADGVIAPGTILRL